MSRLIMQLTGGQFSHAGICSRGSLGEAVDAYPREPHNAVASQPISEFFDQEQAPSGGEVYRYRGVADRAREAAEFSIRQTSQEYIFDIMDPILGADHSLLYNERLYCSEFVWRCYRDGAGITLVEPQNFCDVSQAATTPILAQMARERMEGLARAIANQLPDWKLAGVARLKSVGHNGRFVTPSQLATSHLVQRVGGLP